MARLSAPLGFFHRRALHGDECQKTPEKTCQKGVETEATLTDRVGPEGFDYVIALGDPDALGGGVELLDEFDEDLDDAEED
jgi:hypothetical protein